MSVCECVIINLLLLRIIYIHLTTSSGCAKPNFTHLPAALFNHLYQDFSNITVWAKYEVHISRVFVSIYLLLFTLLSIYLSICAKGRGVQWALGAQNWQSEVSFSTLDTHTHRALPQMSPDQSVKTRSMWSPCDPPAWKTFSLDNVSSLNGFKCASLPDNILTFFFFSPLSHTLAQRAFCGLRWCNAPQDSTACMLVVDPALQCVSMESSLRQWAELSWG